MNESIRNRFDTALRLRDEERYVEALELLESLRKEPIDEPALLAGVYCQIGNIYLFQLERPSDAESAFRSAISRTPQSELCSLGLFHSLMRQKRVEEALAEMKRFLTDNSSEEYTRVLAEIGESLNPKARRRKGHRKRGKR